MKPAQKLSDDRDRAYKRRLAVAALRRAGHVNQQRMAAQLHVCRSTIQRDWLIVDEWWRKEAAQDVAVARGKDLARTEELLKAIWPKARAGQLEHLDRAIKLLDRRARYLGLDAPEKIDVSGIMAEEAKRLAEELGLDVKSVIREAQGILKEAKA